MNQSITAQIAALRRMTVAELQEQWFRLYGASARSRNKCYLWKCLSWRLQELQHGGLSDRAEQRIEELAPDSFVRGRTPTQAVATLDPQPILRPRRDARLPTPGTVLTKLYKNRELRAVIREEGVEFDGSMFGSLTALAKQITGCKSINGKLFFGLSQRKRG